MKLNSSRIPDYLIFGIVLFLLVGFVPSASARQTAAGVSSEPTPVYISTRIDIEHHLQSLKDTSDQSRYRIALCADVPDNRRPNRVAYKQETGHVFLILQRINITGDTIHKVFGFYPIKGLPTLFFKRTKSLIKDNSHREYDVEISLELNRLQFDTVLERCISLGRKKYHLNKFNCYDYALQIFNSVAGAHPLETVYVRFPFPFGRGGSPCSVFRDLQKLKQGNSEWTEHIRFADMIAPVSEGRPANPTIKYW